MAEKSSRSTPSGYRSASVAAPVLFAVVASGVLEVPWQADAIVLTLMLVGIARWYAFFWRVGMVTGRDPGYVGTHEIGPIATDAREAFEGLYRRDVAVAAHLPNDVVKCVRWMLVEENAYWSLLAASLAGWTAWPYQNGSGLTIELVVLVASWVTLAVGLALLLYRNMASIRWIDRQLAQPGAVTA